MTSGLGAWMTAESKHDVFDLYLHKEYDGGLTPPRAEIMRGAVLEQAGQALPELESLDRFVRKELKIMSADTNLVDELMPLPLGMRLDVYDDVPAFGKAVCSLVPDLKSRKVAYLGRRLMTPLFCYVWREIAREFVQFDVPMLKGGQRKLLSEATSAHKGLLSGLSHNLAVNCADERE